MAYIYFPQYKKGRAGLRIDQLILLKYYGIELEKDFAYLVAENMYF